MKNINISTLALAIGFALSTGAMAESMSKKQHKALEKKIDAEYKVAKKACDSLSGNAEDICEAKAKGTRNTAEAELKYNYNPTNKALYQARVAKADADYSVANQKCDDKDGNVEDVCEKEAIAVKVQETAAAEAQLKTTKADAVAIEKSSAAREDAEKEMRDANYAVAKEKCEALDGKAEDLCMSDAKVHFDSNNRHQMN
jgi:hypothetical protein